MNNGYIDYLQNRIVAGNSLMTRLSALGIVFLILAIIWRFKKRALIALKRYSETTSTNSDDFVSESLEALPYSFFVMIAVYLGAKLLTIPGRLDTSIYIAFVVLAISQIGFTLGTVILHFLQKMYFSDEEGRHTISFLRILIKVIVSVIVVLMILNNLGIEITPLITSLGIVGIAVAFSLQNILEDLFSSVSLFVDKPFLIGDYVEIGDLGGTVKSIGIKTTRITTIRGEELVVANRKLTNETVRNYGKMDHRTITEEFTIQGNITALESLSKEFYTIFEGVSGVSFVRVHLKSFSELGITYRYRYTLTSNNYALYLDTQETINIRIIKLLEKVGARLAVPTRHVIMDKA